jgi:AraC-like DNA-binding protein
MSPQVIGGGQPQNYQMSQLPWPLVSDATRQPLLAPLTVTKAGLFHDARGHWIERTFTEEYILNYCVGGRGWFRYRDQEMAVNTGDLLVVPLESHAYGSDDTEPWTVHWAHLRGEHAGLLLERAGFAADRPIRQVGRRAELVTHFQRLFAAVRAGLDEAHLLAAAAQARVMLAYLILLQRDDTGAANRVAAALHHMQTHLDEALTLSQMAATAGLSVPHFSRLFRRQFGRSPVDYFLHLKVGAAREQLETTDLSIVSIARQLGYRDPYYFSRLFKTLTGCSPTAYRRRRRGA